MSKKVLIIEDEEGIANAFKKQLELIAGYEVTWYQRGDEALKLLQNEKFDVILLDLVMPDYDGIAFLTEFRNLGKKYNTTPVIILTNVTSDITKDETEKLGAKKYIVKTSITPDELISEIEDAINPNLANK